MEKVFYQQTPDSVRMPIPEIEEPVVVIPFCLLGFGAIIEEFDAKYIAKQ